MSRPRLFLLIAAVLLFAVRTLAATERVLIYDELPKLIKERNENVQAAEAHHKASKERTGYFGRSLIPQLSASVGAEEFKAGSVPAERQGFWEVQGRINLYRGGRDRLESEIRKSSEKRARAEYTVEANSELREARTAYWKLVAVSKLIADRREALEKTEGYIRGSKRRTGAGVSTNADTLQFELQKTLLNQDLKKLTLEEDLLKNQLSVAIGLDDHEGLRISADFPHPPEIAETNSPDPKDNVEVQALEAIRTTELLRRDQSSRWWLPQVDLYSKYGIPSLDDGFGSAVRQDREFALGIVMTLDLGVGFENRFEAQARSYEAIASEKRAAHKMREVRAADHELRHDMKLLHELIHDADRDIEKAEQFLRLTQTEYSRGVKNGPDLLEASKMFYEFKERRTSLYREYHEAAAQLSALTAKAE